MLAATHQPGGVAAWSSAQGSTSNDPPHELVAGRIEETKFDRYAERSCDLALLVAFGASPESVGITLDTLQVTAAARAARPPGGGGRLTLVS